MNGTIDKEIEMRAIELFKKDGLKDRSWRGAVERKSKYSNTVLALSDDERDVYYERARKAMKERKR